MSQVLNPRTSACDLIWKRVFEAIIAARILRLRDCQITQLGPTSREILIRDPGNRDGAAASRRDAQSHWKLERERNGFSLRARQGAQPCRHLDFGL